MTRGLVQLGTWLASYAPWLLLLIVAAVFSALSPRFLSVENALNILVQSATTATVTIGMTYVLLTGGIDLSVGSMMFLGAALCGKLIERGYPVILSVLALLAVGPLCGFFHGLLITRLRVTPFIVTLASLFLLEGLGLWISQTRAMNLPDDLRQVVTARWLGIPFPVIVLLALLGLFQFVLVRTPFGRHVLAIGQDPFGAHKAGLSVKRVQTLVYVISGTCAGIGALILLAQLSAVSPTFGRGKELHAITAAVLGGTSLFGGRGSVFPGVLLGSVIVQMVENGLVLINLEPYLHPLITSPIVFLAVLVDGLRYRLPQKN